jgi:hypothetical protein
MVFWLALIFNLLNCVVAIINMNYHSLAGWGVALLYLLTLKD